MLSRFSVLTRGEGVLMVVWPVSFLAWVAATLRMFIGGEKSVPLFIAFVLAYIIMSVAPFALIWSIRRPRGQGF